MERDWRQPYMRGGPSTPLGNSVIMGTSQELIKGAGPEEVGSVTRPTEWCPCAVISMIR